MQNKPNFNRHLSELSAVIANSYNEKKHLSTQKTNPNHFQTQFPPPFRVVFPHFFSNRPKPGAYNRVKNRTFDKLILPDSERYLSYSFLKPVKVGHATKKSNAVGNGVAFSSSILYNNFVGLEKCRKTGIFTELSTRLCVLSGRKTVYFKG